jgi:hypothetical protein
MHEPRSEAGTGRHHPTGEPLRRLGEALATLAVYAALCAVFLWPVIAGYQTLIRTGDSVDQSFMWLSKVFAAARAGHIALWDFGINSGTSFIGELQTAPLYPPALLFGLVAQPGDPHAFDLFLVLHYLLAALGMHMLCRALGLPWLASVFGGMLFAFGTAFALRSTGQPNLFASLAWGPWIVAGSQWCLREQMQWRAVALASFCGAFIAMSFLAGHAHGTIVAIMAAALLSPCALRLRRAQWRETWGAVGTHVLLCAAFIGGTAAAMALPQIVATREYLGRSYKWYGPGYTTYPDVVPYSIFADGSIHLRDFASVLTGHLTSPIDGGPFYFTWIGLLLATAGVAICAWLRFWSRLAICCIAKVVVAATFEFSAFHPFGWFYYHLPIANLIRTPGRVIFLFDIGAVVLAAFGLVALTNLMRGLGPRVSGVARHAIATIVGVLAIAIGAAEIRRWPAFPVKEMKPSPSADVAWVLDNPVVRDLVARSHASGDQYRFFADRAVVPPNIGDLCPLLSANGYRSSRTAAYHNYFNFDPKSPIMDRFGVRWWVSAKPVDGMPIVARYGKVVIQERESALPVFWLADDTPRGTPAPIKSIQWGQNDVRVDFDQPVSGKLVFGTSDYPGWSATADGLPVLVAPYENLLSIDVPRPTTSVRFVYTPAWWMPTAVIAMAAIIWTLACAASLVVSRRSPRAKDQFAF